MGLCTLGCGNSSEKPSERLPQSEKPFYSRHTNNEWITFGDNFAPFMRAYIVYGEGIKEMVPFNKSESEYTFKISKEALNAGEFTAYAIDKDGNKSKETQFYVVDGVVLPKK